MGSVASEVWRGESLVGLLSGYFLQEGNSTVRGTEGGRKDEWTYEKFHKIS
jgi:hypothetical protein